MSTENPNAVAVTAVAVTKANDDGDLYLSWLLEGGIAELEHPGVVLLATDGASLTGDDGHGEVYLQPQASAAQSAPDEREAVGSFGIGYQARPASQRAQSAPVVPEGFAEMSPEAASTVRGMVEYCLNQRVCLGMDEGFKSFEPEVEHDFVKELRAFAEGAAAPQPAAPGWTRAEKHDDISGDFEGYCWIDNRTGLRHWLPRGWNPNEKEPTAINGGPLRCQFAPKGWACINHARHEGPCLAVKVDASQPAARQYDFNPEHTLFNEIRTSTPVNEDGEPVRYIISEQQLQRIRALEAATPAARQEQGEAASCLWKREMDSGIYETECGQTWAFTDGTTPDENSACFCHHCGGALKVQQLIAYQVGDNDIVAAYDPEGAIEVLSTCCGYAKDEFTTDDVVLVNDETLDATEAFDQDEGKTIPLEKTLRQELDELSEPAYLHGWE